jgi:hypothetical protein
MKEYRAEKHSILPIWLGMKMKNMELSYGSNNGAAEPTNYLATAPYLARV